MWNMIRKRQQKKGEEGFTLIELIIVIAILGFLLMIAIPRFTAARADAAKRSSQANARNIANAIELYMTTENEYDPPTHTEINNGVIEVYLPQSPQTPGGNNYSYAVDGTSYFVWDSQYQGTGTDGGAGDDDWYVKDGGIVVEQSVGQTGNDIEWGR